MKAFDRFSPPKKSVCLLVALLLAAPLSANRAAAQDGEESGEKPKETDTTSRQIIDLHLKARGGRQNILAVRSLKAEGTITEGGTEFNAVWYWKWPNKYREERSHRKLGRTHTEVRAFDGASGWKQTTAPTLERAQTTAQAESAELRAEADLHGPLMNWEAKGHAFLYTGERRIGDRNTYVLEGSVYGGQSQWFYIDAENFLIVKTTEPLVLGGQAANVDCFPKKMMQMKDAWWVRTREYSAQGKTLRTVHYSQVAYNPALDDSLFALPSISSRTIKNKPRDKVGGDKVGGDN